MDYNNFLIFIANKGLQPLTDTDQKEQEENNSEKLNEKTIPLTKG
jgi:hypothetical protein